MQNSSRFYLTKFLHKHPFSSSPRPISPIPLKSLLQAETQLTSIFVPSPSPNFFSRKSYLFQSQAQFVGSQNSKRYTTESGAESGADVDINKHVDVINLKFAEAREEIELAMESKETVYFNEEAQSAKTAVKEVLDKYEALMTKISEPEKAALQRSMGLKIEQLKAELQQLEMEDQ
ncbi:hypothetical protein SLEP1_g4698 [Rubroshorea leprosula]|uniref:Late embryogenesis abundant protein n=1 Tax=Rubroshorea leprosula TaxID=152421 RepID=A0AAV5I014_9ROSI|nr:hypothetical protein SLEP1_g4698 [Rubroshorea leprosula]